MASRVGESGDTAKRSERPSLIPLAIHLGTIVIIKEVEMIRVIAIEDHPLMRMMLAEKLSGQSDMVLVGTAEHGSQLFRLVWETSPDVVVLDLRMATSVRF
jgi:PleD family two-component response regulator